LRVLNFICIIADMAAHELSWSAFLREPTSVEPWLERGDVLLRRREGESLRLSLESSEAARRDALLAAVRLLTFVATHEGSGVLDETSIAGGLPWTRFLSAADRQEFAREFLQTLEACADLGDLTAVGRLVEDWKTTAGLHAEGMGDRLKRPIRKIAAKVRRP
jgi:hypothetical protein